MPINKGDNFKDQANESFLDRISRVMALNMMKPITRANTGEMIQLNTTASSLPQLITENPPAMMPKPIMAPTIEWVVDTGSDFQVANDTHRAAASRADRAPMKRQMRIGENFGGNYPFSNRIGDMRSDKGSTGDV